jgi:hypothetical protein
MYFDAEQLESEFADWLDEHKPKSFPAGSFYVDCHEGSGDKTLFFGADKKELPFSEWRISEAYQEREDMRHDMLCDGESEDAISEAWKAIEVEYEAYCESNKYATNYDE